MKSCLQIKVSNVQSINNHVSTSQICSTSYSTFVPLIILDGIVFVDFNGKLAQVFVKKEYGKK